ncbi:MAG: hypothetical protein EOO73_06765 [Myxococcales bacterium]|nr:MAG: hypothetical protein EOO73_06765 [Myxococcales bacterium]
MSIRAVVLALACCVVSPSPVWATEGSSPKASTGETRTLPGGAVLTFSKGAKYELGKPIKLQLSPTGSDKTPVQVIKLSAGRVSIVIPDSKKPKTAVLVQAPRKVSAVAKGGQSIVIAAPDRVTVAAVKGEMLAALGNDWKTLPSGVVRSHGAGASTDQAVPAAPQLRLDERLLLALTGETSTKLHAQPQEVAYRELSLYRVEGGKRVPLSSHQEWRGDLQQLPPLAPGRYEVQARAVDRFGVESVMSEPVTLRVIGAVLPEGARLSDGAILLGRAGRVKLIGAEGLEASYGKASLFIPVPADVGLARGDSTLLRLREPGAKAELRIPMEPRTLRAEVEIGPKSARWPTDPLQVTVKLFDHRGRPIVEALKTKPRVFVNVGQVEPSWTHSGNTYTAKVAPAAGTGPWVVRVEVSDDFGDSAGRDFIELGSAKTASVQ